MHQLASSFQQAYDFVPFNEKSYLLHLQVSELFYFQFDIIQNPICIKEKTS